MNVRFEIIPTSQIEIIIPYLQELGQHSIPKEVLRERVLEMATQNYECLGIYDDTDLIGICGMWFQTRHYSGRSLEVDHVIISDLYRSKGIGNLLMEFVYDHARNKKCNWVELNTYVDNYPSHKFYYNQGFISRGYHMIKKLS